MRDKVIIGAALAAVAFVSLGAQRSPSIGDDILCNIIDCLMAQEDPDDPQHWAPVNEERFTAILGKLRAHPERAYWTADERRKLADDIDALALSADDPVSGPGEQSIVMAVDQLTRIANGLRARSSFSPPQLAAALASYAQLPDGVTGAAPPAGIETLERAPAGTAPTPNQSYLVKQMQTTIAACLADTINQLSDGAPSVAGAWGRAHDIVHTPSGWRISDQVFHYRGTISGQPNTGAYVKFSNARWDPESSDINYGQKKVAQNVNVTNDAKTKLIKNDSDAVVSVSYTESEELTNAFSTSVTHGLTLDMTVSSETTVSGEYAGVSAEEKVTAEFGVEKSDEESREESEEGTQAEELSIEFDAAPGEYYLVTLTKEHEVTYQDFRIDGIMDFDWEIAWGSVAGGRLRSHRPSGTVHLQGVAGFNQFVHGYDTNYPSMQGFYNSTYSRTKNGINCIIDPGHRRIQVAGTNQASLESNADYQVESLGHDVPDHLAHLPVEDANDVNDGNGQARYPMNAPNVPADYVLQMQRDGAVWVHSQRAVTAL